MGFGPRAGAVGLSDLLRLLTWELDFNLGTSRPKHALLNIDRTNYGGNSFWVLGLLRFLWGAREESPTLGVSGSG